ncbi:hypothetical protein H0I23_16160 [Cellulophaga sp. HaHaR_3_176]|uniref:hypothetical protein n=1 Tax=Cellulophaga sp. HaHaR_3_176 TaxID=1942464 RepID=UPI001C1FC652|nr:hypothetical protein [Cellulophaga sp. HaHaR_3_176]QWX83960.1 hypothetical protein H0I23_16160 [Cellulophaga sp. HaHaR_3_176]
MKKTLFIVSFLLLALSTNAQEGLKLGIQGGLPFDDFNDVTGVVVGADLGYMAALGEVVDLGVMVGYIYGFPEKFGTEDAFINLPSVQFIPVAISGRVWTSNSFSFGVDVGQAFGINEGNKGGFYYRPQIGFLMSASTELNFSHTSISLDDNAWKTVTVGILHTFEF